MKRVLSLVLVLLMLAGMLLSCQKQEDPYTNPDGSSTVVPDGEVDLERVDEEGYVADRLPTGDALAALGFAGSTVKVLGYEEEMDQTFPKEDSSSDPIKSKLYYHWKGIEEQFDITFNVKHQLAHMAHQTEFFTEARSDSANYDLIQTQSLFPISLATEGRLCNLMKLGFPDREMPWWPESVYQYSQYGGLYFIGSNSSACGISNMSAIFVDDEMIKSKGEASPVESVLRGVWT
ncbi:MAG: hypothetical protein IJW62_04690, partial [Clostridia bacterium]|nr:hypothetical protein [Clostridia bacterium]